MRFVATLRAAFALGLLAGCSAPASAVPDAMSILELGRATAAPQPVMMRAECFSERPVAFSDILRIAQQQALAVSPSGRFRALPGAGPLERDAGVVIADLVTDEAQIWAGVQPVMWDGRGDKLVVRDRRGLFFTTTGLDRPFVLLDVPFRRRPPLLFGAHGVLFFGDATARGSNPIWIHRLSGEVQRLRLPRPIADAGVACSGPDSCIPYVEYEDQGEGGTFRRHAVALSNGRETVFSIDGRELDFVGLGPDARFAIALARRGPWRSLWMVAANGTITPAGGFPADQDYVRAVVDRDGTIAAAETFTGEYFERGAAPPVDTSNQLWGVTPGGLKVFQTRPSSARASLTLVDPAGQRRITDFACASNAVIVGEPLQSRGALSARGAYFRPGAAPRGVVAYFPGGEYRAFAGRADSVVSTLLDQGFAVVVVQARGRPGFGGAFLYDQGPFMDDRTAADADDLLAQAIARERLPPAIRRWAVGVSAGSRPALAALMSRDASWSGGLILAGACAAGIDQAASPARRRTPSYPLVADGLRSAVASCDGVVPAGRKILVVHGLDDAAAAPDDMKRMVSANPHTTRARWLKGRGHDLPPNELIDIMRGAVAYWSGAGEGASPTGPEAARSVTAR